MQIYRTKDNEDVYIAARDFGISPMKISEDNELSAHTNLPCGRELLIIQPTRTYNVKSRDTLDVISRKFNVSKDALKRMNPELKGRERLYSGQLLTVKNDGGGYGMICTNGYFYRGCTSERLLRIMPYLSYVTVCSAVYKDGCIYNTFSPSEAVATVKSHGRTPLLRIYLTEMPKEKEIQGFASSAAIITKSGGFGGVTLSSLFGIEKNAEVRCGLVLALRKALMDADLFLFAEADAETDCSHLDYANAGVLTYDKLHKKDIPTFTDGENSIFEKYADRFESSRAFIEIPSFAYTGEKYIEKGEAMHITDKKRGELKCDIERGIICAKYGKKKQREIIFESLENTKAKLGLISELGYLGVSFDIGRVCIADLMMTSTMFEIINHPMSFIS